MKLKEIDPGPKRTYYKGVQDIYSGEMKSMNYGKEHELDKIFKVDTSSPLVNNLRQVADKE